MSSTCQALCLASDNSGLVNVVHGGLCVTTLWQDKSKMRVFGNVFIILNCHYIHMQDQYALSLSLFFFFCISENTEHLIKIIEILISTEWNERQPAPGNAF